MKNNFLKNNWLNLLIITILVVVTYGTTLQNVFLSDDLAEIAQNPRIGDFNLILNYPLGSIRHIIYWVIYNIGGLNPTFFRLTNILFHLGSAYLIYILLSLIYKEDSPTTKAKRLGLIAASIFAVHPGFSEAVVWISGGMYAQYTFFFLFSLVLYIFSEKNKKVYLLSIVSFLFTFMSHYHMPLALFLIFPLYEFVFRNFKKNYLRVLPYFLITIVYVFVNLSGLSERETTLQQMHYQEKGVDNPLIQIPVAFSSYFELLFWPKTLTLYHSELAFGPLMFILRAFVTVLFILLILMSFKKNKSVFFWLTFFILSLSPTLTPFRLNWIVAERYLYLPSLGIIVPVAYLFNKFADNKKYRIATFSILTVIIIILSVRTLIRNNDWKNEDNLWIATGKTSPSSPNTHNNLGDVYGRWGDKQRALQEFQTAIALKPNYADAYHNLANTYRELGQIDKALESYQKAAQLNPLLWQSYQNIAAIYFEMKQYDKSLEFIQKAIAVNPRNLNLVNNLAIVYLIKGDKEKAKQIFSQMLIVDPQNQLARQGLIEASK